MDWIIRSNPSTFAQSVAYFFPSEDLNFSCRQFKAIVTFYTDLHPEPIITRIDALTQYGWWHQQSRSTRFQWPHRSDNELAHFQKQWALVLLSQTVLLISSPIIFFIVSVNLGPWTTSYSTTCATSALSSCFALNSGTVMIMQNSLADSPAQIRTCGTNAYGSRLDVIRIVPPGNHGMFGCARDKHLRWA